MHSDAGWSDVTIRNISRRGFQISTSQPVKPGAYIELRRAHYTIVARIAWTADGKVGARSQDVIDVSGLLAVSIGKSPGDGGQASPPASPHTHERRSTPRHDVSRQRSSRLQFAAMIATVVAAAVMIASDMGTVLAQPLAAAKSALAGAP